MSLNSFLLSLSQWSTLKSGPLALGFCGVFEAIGYFLGTPVVHSAEWTTGSIFQAQITHYIIYDIMGFLHHVKFLVQALGDMLEQLALTLLQWLVAQLNCGH